MTCIKRGVKHWLLVLVATLLLSSSVVLAQSGGGYRLVWSTVDSGGSQAGGPYRLDATAGQPDVGAASGGEYELRGAFWSSASPFSGPPDLGKTLYLPAVLR